MKIPNYDRNKQENPKNNFFDEDFRLLIAGESGCGKTNTLMHILRKPLSYYDKIYIFTPNLHQDKIQDLQELMQKMLVIQFSSIGDGGSGPCCAKNPTQKNVPKTPPRKKPV